MSAHTTAAAPHVDSELVSVEEAMEDALVASNTAGNTRCMRSAPLTWHQNSLMDLLKACLPGRTARQALTVGTVPTVLGKRRREESESQSVGEKCGTKRGGGRLQKVHFNDCTQVRLLPNTDVTVSTPRHDGPPLISKITSNLIVGVATKTVTGPDNMLDLVASFLPNELAYRMHTGGILAPEVAFILADVEAKLAKMIDRLQQSDEEHAHVGLLPGTLRVSESFLPPLVSLRKGLCAALQLSADRQTHALEVHQLVAMHLALTPCA